MTVVRKLFLVLSFVLTIDEPCQLGDNRVVGLRRSDDDDYEQC